MDRSTEKKETGAVEPRGLRVVTFNVLLPAYQLIAEWAGRHGHKLILLVTLPGQPDEERYGAAGPNLIGAVAPQQDILVTRRLRTVAAPVIASLQPDLIISATFPRRIPAEIIEIPRYGALNLHPAPLPKGRGPNPLRLVYEGDGTIGAALHRLAPEFDAGPILSRREIRLSDDVTPGAIFGGWMKMLPEVLEEGAARAIAGEPGEQQDEREATHGMQFTDEEHWLSWNEPASVIRRKAAALNLMGPKARVSIDGTDYLLADVLEQTSGSNRHEPGDVLDRSDDIVTIGVQDGSIKVKVAPLVKETEIAP